MIQMLIKTLLQPIKAYRAFCESCDALDETTRHLEHEGKFA